MRAVDANVLLRLIVQDDPQQLAEAHRFVERGVWASHLVLAETIWTLRTAYAFEHAEIADIIDLLLKHESLVLQDPNVGAAVLDQYRRRPSLGFSDCLILETARKAGHLPLGTFDKALGRLEGAERL